MMKLHKAAVTSVPQVSMFIIQLNYHGTFLVEIVGTMYICRIAFCPRRKVQFHESLSSVNPDVNLFSTALLLFSLQANNL